MILSIILFAGFIMTRLTNTLNLPKVSGYILEEKVEIAARHLVPKQLEAHGLSKGKVKLPKRHCR